jgi:hypothetical protein
VIAAPEPVQHRHPTPAKQADLTRLRPRAELQLDRPFDRVGLDRRAERSLRDREVDRREDVVALAHEAWIRLHVNADVHVTGACPRRACVAFAGQADLLPVVDARRNRHLERPLLEDAACALAFAAGRLDDATVAAAAWAALRADELSEDASRHLLQAPGAVAVRTG